jgi:hypothetical protein
MTCGFLMRHTSLVIGLSGISIHKGPLLPCEGGISALIGSVAPSEQRVSKQRLGMKPCYHSTMLTMLRASTLERNPIMLRTEFLSFFVCFIHLVTRTKTDKYKTSHETVETLIELEVIGINVVQSVTTAVALPS